MAKLISFLGPMGSGKTTRAKLLSDFLCVAMNSEKADSPFLKDMFASKQNVLLNQLYYLYRNRDQILENYHNTDDDYLVYDYYIAQVDIFSKYFLNIDEYKEFSQHYKEIYKQLPVPDLIVYLYLDKDLNLKRIKNSEFIFKNIDLAFVEHMHKYINQYLDRIKKETIVLEIDASHDVIESFSTRLDVLMKMTSCLPI